MMVQDSTLINSVIEAAEGTATNVLYAAYRLWAQTSSTDMLVIRIQDWYQIARQSNFTNRPVMIALEVYIAELNSRLWGKPA